MKNLLHKISHYYSYIQKVILFLVSLILLLLIFPRESKFRYEYQKNKPWQYNDLIASYDIPIIKPKDVLLSERADIINNAKVYFFEDNEIVKKKREILISDFENSKNLLNITPLKKSKHLNLILRIFDDIYSAGVIERNKYIENKDSDYSLVVVDTDNVAREVKLSSFYSVKTSDEYIFKELSEVEEASRAFLINLLENSIEYNVLLNENATELEQETLLNSISETRGMIQKGQKIITKGEIINNEKYASLESYKSEYEGEGVSVLKHISIILGQLILITMSLIVLALFLFSFRREVFNNNRKILLILFLILIVISATSLLVQKHIDYLNILPICIIPIIIRSFFDTRLALFVHLVTIILIGFLVPNSFEFVFLQFITGIIIIISVVKLQKRIQFFTTSALVFIVYSTLYIGLTLSQEGSIYQLEGQKFLLFAGSAILVLSAYPLIFLFERFFGFVTDVSLMELSDTNSPLLRDLSKKAPGTFQHSLQISNMAEEVIFEIGGNSLLVRTGALYHDIGKMEMPMYFIENQSTGVNPHNELSYTESASIIISHIIKGIEIAKKNGLPDIIIDFIRTHHGTKRTEYFYTLYKNENPDENIDASLFTYKGPLPYSKETCVLMMTDAVEAASKSLRFPDETNIDNLVEHIIDSQMAMNQYQNSNITIKDITIAKKIFKRLLMNRYHLRIEYPQLTD